MLVLDDLPEEVRIALIAHGRIQRGGANGGGAKLGHAAGGHAHLRAHFLVGRLAAQHLQELHRHAAQLGNLVHQMDGEADGFALVGEGALDGLLDPPRAVGGELATFLGVKALDGFHQADVALVDEIEQRHPEPVVVVGDLHNKAEVGLDHQFARCLVALLNLGGEIDLLLDGQQRHLANFAKVEPDGALAVVGRADALGGFARRGQVHARHADAGHREVGFGGRGRIGRDRTRTRAEDVEGAGGLTRSGFGRSRLTGRGRGRARFRPLRLGFARGHVAGREFASGDSRSKNNSRPCSAPLNGPDFPSARCAPPAAGAWRRAP